MEGPEHTATVPLGVVHAVRQRPATAVDDHEAARFEVEWATSLGEDRKLALRSGDVGAVERMCRVVEASLRDLDQDMKRHGRFWDWPLATLLTVGVAYAVTRAATAQAPITTYDWVATVTQFLFDAFTVPLLYVIARAAVRAWRRRRPI
jgi:hypothetical protein